VVGLAGDVEGVGADGGVEQREGALVVLVHDGGGRGARYSGGFIERGEEGLALIEAVRRDVSEELELADAVVIAAGVGVDGEGVEGGAEPAGELAVAFFDEAGDVVLQLGPHGDEGRERVSAAAEPGEDGADVGPVFAEVCAVGGRRLAGEEEVSGGGVIDVAVRHGADDGKLVGVAGEEGEVLADIDAGDAGGDGFEEASDFGGGFGLEVPGILVGGAAPHEEEDAGLGASEGGAEVGVGGGAALEELGEREPEEAEAAGAEDIAAGGDVWAGHGGGVNGRRRPWFNYSRMLCQGQKFGLA
jgi:hypothetical protein